MKQFDVKFSGDNPYRGMPIKSIISVFALNKEDAIEEFDKAIKAYGYKNVTTEHITK
jgi:hypothetical protein